MPSHTSEAESELQPGQSVGPYRVEALLGEGGMGRVYEAVGPRGQRVALKFVKEEIARDQVFRRRFNREADIARRIAHPHVVPVTDVGEHEGLAYMAQRYIRGGSLQQKIEREGPLQLEFTVTAGLQVAAGLDALHAAGLVHRDVKPGNILLDKEGSAYITDFGLAKGRQMSVLTKPGQTLGSMDYMAPEQIRGEDVSAVTDVYALGCVLFECLSGLPPFADRQGTQVLWSHMQDEPPDPCAYREDAPEDLSWAVTRALEKQPARRPPTPTAYMRMVQVAAGVPPLSPGGNK